MANRVKTVTARRVCDFADVAGDWNLIGFTLGPFGSVHCLVGTTLYPGQTFPIVDWHEAESKLSSWSAHSVLSAADSADPSWEYSLILPPTPERYLEAFPLPNRQWLLNGRIGYSVINHDGEITRSFDLIGGFAHQVTPDGRVWGILDDQSMAELHCWDGAVCFDAWGKKLFVLNEYAHGGSRAPLVWSAEGLNVVSDSEAWLCYLDAGGSHIKTSGTCLVKLVDFEATDVIPWRTISGRSPISTRGFAVAKNELLIQGEGGPPVHYRTERSPHGRLYRCSLDRTHVEELLPVDEHGQWIGEFWGSQGQGSRLYLRTRTALFMVDLLNL